MPGKIRNIDSPSKIRERWLESKGKANVTLDKCFSTAGPRPGTGPWHQLHLAARGSPGICHFNFL